MDRNSEVYIDAELDSGIYMDSDIDAELDG